MTTTKNENKNEMMLTAQLFVAAEASEDKDALPTFRMVANAGSSMKQPWSDIPIVLNLASVQLKDKVSIRKGHYGDEIGHSISVKVENNELVAEGVFSGYPEVQAAKNVVALGRNGFPWETSVAGPVSIKRIEKGKSVTVNGQDYKGPILVGENMQLQHIAILDAGADNKTSVLIAGNEPTTLYKESIMENGETKAAEPVVETKQVAASAEPNVVDVAKLQASMADSQKQIETMKAELAEEKRVHGIESLSYDNAELKAEAIKDGVSVQDAELKLLRAAYSEAPGNINIKTSRKADPKMTANVMAAALQLHTGASEDEVKKKYDEQTLEAGAKYADRGIVEIAAEILRADGASVPYDAVEIIEAAASRITLSTILGSTADLNMIRGFINASSSWRKVTRTVSIDNYKTNTMARIEKRGKPEETADDGKIVFNRLVESTYTHKLLDYADGVKFTARDLANDSQNALARIPAEMGRKADTALEKAVITALLANTSSFFASANYNYADVSSYPLSVDGLTQAVKVFSELRDADGDFILELPKYLIVPPALATVARQLMNSVKLNYVGDDESEKGELNPHANLAEVVVSPYLGTAGGITNASESGWYLFADPMSRACVEVGLYKNRMVPKMTVASTPFDETTGGKQMKIEHAWDAVLAEEEGGVAVI